MRSFFFLGFPELCFLDGGLRSDFLRRETGCGHWRRQRSRVAVGAVSKRHHDSVRVDLGYVAGGAAGATLLWATLELAESHRLRDWCAYGLLWGFTLMTNPSLGSLLPFLLGWAAYRV